MTRRIVALLGYATLPLLLTATAHADDEVTAIDFCRDYSQVANQVMTARQQDRPMSEVLPEATEGLKNWGDRYALDMDDAEEGAAAMVMAAYEVMISPVEEYKRKSVTEFENALFKACYESLNSDLEE